MAQAILLRGGAGGVTSDDVTAGKTQVLQGYKTVTTDSDDEVAEGTMVNRGNGMDTVEFLDAYWESKYVARMEQGFYAQVDQWKPYVAIPYAVLANGIHLDANKMLDTLQVAGIRGNIRTYGAWNAASEVVNATWENKVHVRFEEGCYSKDGNYKPAAIVPYDVLANAIGIDASKMLSALNVLGKQGQIKTVDTAESNYRINKSASFGLDGWTNPSNPVFYVDFPHGSAYYTRPDGHPHVCIDAINLGDATADKVMRGFTATSKHGIKFAGTMPDYSTGRMVFRGATFDGTIATGVAKKGFVLNGINRYYDLRSDIRRCEGVNDGGIKLLNSYNRNTRQRSAEDIGCVLSNSINLTPFRQIKVGFVVFNFKGDGTASQPAQIELETGVVSTAEVGGEVAQPFSDYPVRVLGGRSKFISHVMVSTSRNAGNLSDKAQKYLTLDVSDLQGQYFLYFLLGSIQHEYSEGWVHATVLINSIQVIN